MKNSEALEVAANLCRRFEGLHLKPYICPAGVPTIGWGTTRYPNGKPVSLSDPPISKDYADELLYTDLSRFHSDVLALCPGLVGSPGSRIGAVVDFAYNLGSGRLKASTLRRRINERNWPEVKKELMKWVNAGGRPLRGLVLRRQAEANLI
jgi:lysozyme